MQYYSAPLSASAPERATPLKLAGAVLPPAVVVELASADNSGKALWDDWAAV